MSRFGKRGIASNHGDPQNWFPKHEKSMETFRAAVKAALSGSSGGTTPAPEPVPTPTPNGGIAEGSLVEVKPGTANYYPGSKAIPAWVMSDYYHKVTQVTSGGKPVTKGGKTCVLLGKKVNKKTGAEEAGINTWVDKDALALVGAASGGDTYETYTVKKGDTLWGIATAKLGSGSRYPEIKTLNGLTSDTIVTGQVLKVSLPYGQFLGYEKGEDGLPKIVESQAKIVRLIYTLFLQGKTINAIARYLTAEGIPTPAGKEKWNVSTVLSILQNEKYKGDAVLQKGYTVDFLTKKKKKNEGEVPQYYVENSHPAIIEPEVYDLVQVELKKRKSTGRMQSGLSPFSSRIICGECGGFYGSKVWHSTSKYRRTIWQCNHKYKGGDKCQTPHLYEITVQKAFVDAFNQLYGDRERLIEDYGVIIQVLTDTSALDKEATAQQDECDVVMELIRKCVEENAHTALDQDEYHTRYSTLLARYEAAKNRLDEITEEKQSRAAKRESISRFVADLERCSGLLTEFDEALWYETVETVTVHSESDVAIAFKDGSEVRVDVSGK